jgi:hypothetical protein
MGGVRAGATTKPQIRNAQEHQQVGAMSISTHLYTRPLSCQPQKPSRVQHT